MTAPIKMTKRMMPLPTPIRVALVGVGNCASSLVQGVEYYREREMSMEPYGPGLMHEYIGPYSPADIQFVAAFDVASSKVGLDIADAIFAEPNCTARLVENVTATHAKVLQGPRIDGIGETYAKMVPVLNGSKETGVNPIIQMAQVLIDAKVDVLVNYLPVGSEAATRFWAAVALQARCAFVNSIPVFLASGEDPEWRERFKAANLPLIGDDIKSQVGATIVHRMLAQLMEERGVHLKRTYQLNFGGNMDFANMKDAERLTSKKISKAGAVQSVLPQPLPAHNVHIGPSDFVPWLEDRKWAYIRLEAEAFGGVPLNIEMKMEVWDSPNSAGVVIDAVRCAKLAMDHGVGGVLGPVSAYLMKSPPVQEMDEQARFLMDEWIDSFASVKA